MSPLRLYLGRRPTDSLGHDQSCPSYPLGASKGGLTPNGPIFSKHSSCTHPMASGGGVFNVF